MIPTTRFVILSIAFAALGWSASGSDGLFRPGPAEAYAHQSANQVTVGAKSYNTKDLVQEAFGKKSNMLERGVLPVLVVVENKSQKALDLRDLEVSLVATDGRHATAVNPEDVAFVGSKTRRPNNIPTPIPLPKKKNSLASPEIVTRAFAAKMLPPGDSASGFFYFEAQPERGDKLYLNGVREARTGQEMLFFEFPLEQ